VNGTAGGTTDEDRVVKLLEEIRDQQKLHMESVVDMQKRALRRQLTITVTFGIVLIGWMAYTVWRF
jgi:CHASE3 domain sensor protein